jgi:hypothetical protein
MGGDAVRRVGDDDHDVDIGDDPQAEKKRRKRLARLLSERAATVVAWSDRPRAPGV